MGSVEESNVTDVLIIGGGVAGLAAALTLARQLHTAIVFDSEVYRNAPSARMYNLPTWDNKDPKEFRAAARQNILEYYNTIQFQNVEVKSLGKEEGSGLFVAGDSTGATWKGRKVIFAIGVRDIFPDIEGYDKCWSKAMYHCFFCKGYEARGVSRAGVLALPDLATVPTALHFARIARRFASSITIYTHGQDELKQKILDAQGDNQVFNVDNRRIVRFEKGLNFADVVLHFDGGDSVTEGFLGHKPPTEPKGNLHKQLGFEMNAMRDPQSTPLFYETTVKGVFVGGDNASPIKIVPQAIFSGSSAGAACCAQLQAEAWGQPCIF